MMMIMRLTLQICRIVLKEKKGRFSTMTTIIEKSVSLAQSFINGPNRNIGIITLSLLVGLAITLYSRKRYQVKDKIALVTGASSGIGLSIATELAKKGCKVGLIARSEDKLKKVSDALNKQGYQTFYIPCDMGQPDQVKQLPDRLKQIIGDAFVDIIVNNAGSGAWKFIEDTSYQECQDMMALPYFAAFYLTKTFIPRMLAENRGLIVNVNSPVSVHPWPGSIGYACARYAMKGFSCALREEVRGTNIRVMEVMAGETTTNYFENNGIDKNSFPLISRFIPHVQPEKIGSDTVDGIINNRSSVLTPFFFAVCITSVKYIPDFRERSICSLGTANIVCSGQWIYEVDYANAGCTGAVNRVTAFYDGQCYFGGAKYYWYTTASGSPTLTMSTSGCFQAVSSSYPYTFGVCSGSMMVLSRTIPPLPATGFLGFESTALPNLVAPDCLNYKNVRYIERVGACVLLPSFRFDGFYSKAFITTTIGFGIHFSNCNNAMIGTNFNNPMTCSSSYGEFVWGQIFLVMGVSSVTVSNTLTQVSLTTFTSDISGSMFYYTAVLSCPAGQYTMSPSIDPATPTASLTIPDATRGQSCVVQVSAIGDQVVSGAAISGQSAAFTIPLIAAMSSLTPGTVTTSTISFSYTTSTGGVFTVSVGSNYYPECSATTSCTATGLDSNTLYTVSVTVTNAGTVSSPLTYSATTIDDITMPSITVTDRTSTSISVSYPVTGGYGATTYQLRLNTVVQPSCTTSSCTLSGLVYGTIYTVSVTATNDGYSATSLDSVTNFWTLPTMGAVNIVNYGTTWVSFSYSSNNGRVLGANTFAIRVNGVLSTNTTCSSSTSCYVGGLTAGSTPSISILSTNNGETSITPGTASQKLYNSVNTLTVTPSLQTSSSFSISYSSLEGIPGQTTYLVLLDDVSYPSCPTVQGDCSLSPLSPKTYNATVTATNDGLVLVKTIMVLVTTHPSMNPIEVGEYGTTWVEFDYSSIGGTAGGNSYTINVAGSDITTVSCKQGPYCKIVGLTAGSSVVISIYVTNNGEDSSTVSTTVTLYKPTSPPTITLSRISATTLNVSWVENDGVPGQSLFDVLVNGTNICTDITITNCQYSPVSDGSYYNITTIVKNDGFVSSTSITYFTYPPTTPIIVTAIGKNESIYINWTESSGGVPGETKYNVFLSVDNDNWANVCVSSNINFSYNTFYYVMVTVENTDFERLQALANATTLPIISNNPCRSNTTSTVDCSGHGTCPNQECLCTDGWDGQYCEVPTGDGGGGVIIIPKPTNPGIDIDKEGVKYSFTINKVVERDLEMNAVKTLDLTLLKWQPIQQVNATLVHPTNNGSVIRHSWHTQPST
ncbi:hypothetical protein DFA_01099 [Cavenderia fasciculata]|uniref:Fibronectin type-III domain-containing protein n=1 Tax=Cavenderia fasciculata TaxID=261658 RepID=F4PQV9_CACFS|nr:uncharacterized protein DFA_01099 [Cavenderia fasciculata]EGG21224.1 hypothetical protein DFA_01099 [Cavenderia fasciculata]|eukprot:XP_004359074.1 hypothetical protein DFA_01099 [Cavenderia fasciculata]